MIKITETILRDAHQSLIATRMTYDEMEPMLEKMDAIGYYALEMWGGATFDACLRFLDEDPWERLRKIRKKVKNTKLQMLLRGQNILGYKHYADDIVEEFVKRSVANGIDIIRIFDALNDPRNLECALKATKAAGAHAQAAMSYTLSPVHNLDTYVRLAKDYQELGADSLCIKDMSGLLLPDMARKLVQAIKLSVDLPLEIHSHDTAGIATMTYMAAIEAGADIIDTAISPFASGTSQPATESMVAVLANTAYTTGLSLTDLSEIGDHFATVKEKYIESGGLNPKVLSVDVKALKYQVPGGMLSNLIGQLKAQNALDRYEEVLQEVPRVREDLGYPPLVTPTSQMVGTQAVINVLTGERYKMIPKEVKAYVRGYYGKPTVPIAEEVVKKIIGNEEQITCRPADVIKPQLEQFKAEIGSKAKSIEDVLSYALFPAPAEAYFDKHR